MLWLNESYNNDLVSIIIPTFNRAGLIGETIESVFNQNYRPVEIIVADDGSTDIRGNNEKYKSQAPEGVSVKYYLQDKKGGCAARNLGAKYSTGEFIQFFDSDDLMYPDYLSKRIKILRDNPDLDFCVCNCDFYDTIEKNLLPPGRLDLKEHSLEGMLDAGLPVMTHSIIATREVFRSIGPWDEKLLRGQDVEYFSRIFFLKLKGIWIPDILYRVMVHNDNLSQKWSPEICENMIRSYLGILERASIHNMKTVRLKKIISRRITALCISALASGYILIAWKYFWKSWSGLSTDRMILRGGYFTFLTLIKPFRKNLTTQLRDN